MYLSHFLWPPALPVISDASENTRQRALHTVGVWELLHGIKTEHFWPAFPFPSLLRWRWSCEPLGLSPFFFLGPFTPDLLTFHILPLGGYLTLSSLKTFLIYTHVHSAWLGLSLLFRIKCGYTSPSRPLRHITCNLAD